MKHLNRSAFGQNILSKFEGMVRSGGIPKPEWFDAVSAHPPPTLYRAPKPGKLAIPQILKTDRLIDKFEAHFVPRHDPRHPQTKGDVTARRGHAGHEEVIDLIDGGATERLALRFVRRQVNILDESPELAKAEEWVQQFDRRLEETGGGTRADRQRQTRMRRWLRDVREQQEHKAFKEARRMMLKAESVRKSKVDAAETQLAAERSAERVEAFMARFRHQAPLANEAHEEQMRIFFTEMESRDFGDVSEHMLTRTEMEEYHLKNAVHNTFVAAGRAAPEPGKLQGAGAQAAGAETEAGAEAGDAGSGSDDSKTS